MEKSAGSYVGVRLSNKTKEGLEAFAHKAAVPNALDSKDYHTTVMYSRIPFHDKFKPLGRLSVPIVGLGKNLALWPTQDGGNCLVYIYDCPDLSARHEWIMNMYDATYDFPEYIPHITLSYDVGDLKLDELPNIHNWVPEIEIVEEYVKPIDPNWTRGKTNEED